jgi:hypothetical protein
MNIARVVSMPPGNSEWATVRDAYGNNVAVKGRDLPPGANDGTSYAYRVEFITNSGNMTLKPVFSDY